MYQVFAHQPLRQTTARYRNPRQMRGLARGMAARLSHRLRAGGAHKPYRQTSALLYQSVYAGRSNSGNFGVSTRGLMVGQRQVQPFKAHPHAIIGV